MLKNINLSVPSRNFVALVGHTGSGKSTLASLLMGYYPLTEGEIRLDGRPLSTLSHSALRQGVAMVQQDPVVLADTFLANVTLGRDISEERVWQALETVQLAELARSMSDGIYTLLGEQGNNLSVGQKQLLALARVLVETPQILILDEATASIDSGTEQAIQHALAAVREHTTLVVIAHRLSTIVDADTILVLHRGQAVEQGTHQQLLAAQGFVEEVNGNRDRESGIARHFDCCKDRTDQQRHFHQHIHGVTDVIRRITYRRVAPQPFADRTKQQDFRRNNHCA